MPSSIFFSKQFAYSNKKSNPTDAETPPEGASYNPTGELSDEACYA